MNQMLLSITITTMTKLTINKSKPIIYHHQQHTHKIKKHNRHLNDPFAVCIRHYLTFFPEKCRVRTLDLQQKKIMHYLQSEEIQMIKLCTTITISLSLSSRMIVGQCTQPQVHARLHNLVTPPPVCWSSFQSTSRHNPRSLIEGGCILLCHDLAGIAQEYWHVETVCFAACNQENVVVDLVLRVQAYSWRLMQAPWHYAPCIIVA